MTNARQQYTDDLAALQEELIGMATLAERMVAEATDSLVNVNLEKANEVIRMDESLDQAEVELERHCLRIIGLQQPTGADLRVVSTCLKIITDIERVGDLAVDIAKIARKLYQAMAKSDVIDFGKIAAQARQMFRNSIECFIKRDLDRVTQILNDDDKVDDSYHSMRSQIHDWMRKHPESDVDASWLLLALHHIERVGDHATNIAERVYFMETGKLGGPTRPTSLGQ